MGPEKLVENVGLEPTSASLQRMRACPEHSPMGGLTAGGLLPRLACPVSAASDRPTLLKLVPRDGFEPPASAMS